VPRSTRTPRKEPALDQECLVREGPGKRFLEPRLLFLVREKPSYGYELKDRARELPLPGPAPDSAAVYRMLRDLEKRGLVSSEWKPGESGPSKRVYRITPRGRRRLEEWTGALKERVQLLNRFIRMCEGDG
jgi:PadR family transcriptional regulator PadR